MSNKSELEKIFLLTLVQNAYCAYFLYIKRVEGVNAGVGP